jgi:hypothetical protein
MTSAHTDGRVAAMAAEQRWMLDERPARLAFETDLINRAMRGGLTLYGYATADSSLVFDWRSPHGSVGPRFDDRQDAIDWMANLGASDGGVP